MSRRNRGRRSAVFTQSDPSQLRSEITLALRESFFVGPLPDPAALAEYEQIKPGFADRIVVMAEKESAHRRELERDCETAECEHAKRGQWMAFWISMVSLGVAAVLAKTSGGWAATPFAAGGLYPVIAAFLKQRADSAPTRVGGAALNSSAD